MFPRSLASVIHYDVDENLWPNPQDRVYKNIEVQRGTLQLTFYSRPTVILAFFFFFFENLFRVDYFINNVQILFNDSSIYTFLSGPLQ